MSFATLRSFFRKLRFERVLLTLSLSFTMGGAAWYWQSSSFQSSFANYEHLPQENRSRIVKRKQTEIQEEDQEDEQAEAEQERAERIATRIRNDEADRVERMKWATVIGRTASRMQFENRNAFTSRFPLDGHSASPKVTEEEANFWSFQRLEDVKLPEVGDKNWCRNPIDQFILARLESARLSPNTSASRQVLARRLWFDLIGLPPRPDAINSFINSSNSNAYEHLVNRLLENPAFGERWGRVWLDLARYADSNGYEEDEFRPNAYPYRDFVIWAMNADLPFDRFVRWQIAGDELSPGNPLAVAATGFLTAAPLNTFIPQKSERFDELDDIVSTMGNAMLGLTVGCARCHDHKYDPIPTSDYYGLVAIFAKTQRKKSYLIQDEGREYRRDFDPVDERRQEIKRILKARVKEDKISGLNYFTEAEKNLLRQPVDPKNLEQERLISLCERCLLVTDAHLSDDLEPLPKDKKRYDQLKKELRKLEPLLPESPPMGLTLSGSEISKTHVLAGGSLNRKMEMVGPGFLSVVTKGRPAWNDETWKAWAAPSKGSETAGPRSALANWMTDVDSGGGALLARVIVNRLWHHHFGHGLVRTPSDFGNEGEPASHPQLLDWLARELIDHNWSLKHIHRLILTSATYRQGTFQSEEKRRIDPENRLFGRYVPRRITAEMMRDSMLSVAGNLNSSMYGPGIKPPIPRDAVYNTQKDAEDTWPFDFEADRLELWRRSIYVMLKRTVPVPMLQLFDAPSATFSCSNRKVTTVPTQALALWNSPFVIKQSERLSERISKTTIHSHEQVQQLFMLTLSRPPTPQELTATVEFLQIDDGKSDPVNQRKKLAELCHVLFMSNEFFYID